MPINFAFNAISTPAKNKFASLDPNIQDDIIKVVLGKGDPIAQWKEIVRAMSRKACLKRSRKLTMRSLSKALSN